MKKAKVIAHRGGTKWAPENSLSAFRKSVDAGVDGIELDIQRASTGELVVIHDSDVARTTNGVGLVKDISYNELKRLDGGSWFSKEFAGEKIPLLSEVLEVVDGKCDLNIEIKNLPYDFPGIEDDLLDLLQSYSRPDRIIISSFDHYVLRAIHQKNPNFNMGIGLLAACLICDIDKYATTCGAKYWHPNFELLRQEEVAKAQAANLVVNSWTIDSPREWKRAIEMGLDGIITNDPSGLQTFLEKYASARAV
jgi:glycerophosphoryl diester phosphodiesterase